MIKTNEKQQDASVSGPYSAEIPPGRHLVVLISSSDVDFVSDARRIRELAQTSGYRIRLIGLCNDLTQEMSLKRTLISMAAVLNQGSMIADSRVLIGGDWLKTLKLQLHPSDMLVCWEEARTGVFEKPLAQLVRSQLNVPLYILSPSRQTGSRANLAISALTWAGFIAIIVGFFLLQVKIYQWTNDGAITLELLTTAAEFWLIWVWNRLFS